MASDWSTWGPELDQYSRSFDPQLLPDMPNRDIADFYNRYKVLPLTSIQNSLCRSDPRTDILGFTGMKLGHMMEMLRKYTVVRRQTNIFNNYYGFLCVRNLVHITCLGVLRETNSLDHVLRSLQPNANWNTMSKTIAFAALDKAASTIENPRLLREFYQIFTRSCFILDNTTGEADPSLFTTMLWDSRDSFLTLCSRGVLPG
ncbi:hypothetical protein FRC12_007427, partial [Ceratobasidium sp. 428]